jgi:hypothetical protein
LVILVHQKPLASLEEKHVYKHTTQMTQTSWHQQHADVTDIAFLGEPLFAAVLELRFLSGDKEYGPGIAEENHVIPGVRSLGA